MAAMSPATCDALPAIQPHAHLWAAASPLDPAIARSLDELGYAILPNRFDPAWLRGVAERLDALEAEEGGNAAVEHHQEEGAGRLANLINKGAIFDRAWQDPLILACCAHMFRRPFKVSSLNGREAKLGGGHQPLHGDWKLERGDVHEAHVCNGLIAIDDLTVGNGAPRLVPRSHLKPGRPEQLLADCDAPHPEQLIGEVPAGTVIMINAHTWHGGTNNTNGARRRVLHSYFTAREHKQQQDQRRWLRPETFARLTPAQRWLVDVA
jgi:hypothetical protein